MPVLFSYKQQIQIMLCSGSSILIFLSVTVIQVHGQFKENVDCSLCGESCDKYFHSHDDKFGDCVRANVRCSWYVHQQLSTRFIIFMKIFWGEFNLNVRFLLFYCSFQPIFLIPLIIFGIIVLVLCCCCGVGFGVYRYRTRSRPGYINNAGCNYPVTAQPVPAYSEMASAPPYSAAPPQYPMQPYTNQYNMGYPNAGK